VKEINVKKLLESAKLNDPSFRAKILSSLARIADRDPLTEKNCDVDDIPWHDDDFSRRIFPLATKSKKQTVREADFINKNCTLKKGSSILDIASGNGRLSIEFAMRGYSVLGIDKGIGGIEHAMKSVKKLVLRNVKFIHGDVNSIQIKEQFDLGLIIYGALANLKYNEAKKLMKKLSRIIKPDGHLFLEICCLTENVSSDFQEWYFSDSGLWGDSIYLVMTENFFNVRDSYMAIRHWIIDLDSGDFKLVTGREQYYDSESISDLLESAGFRIVETFGDWDGSVYTSESRIMIVKAGRLEVKL
jgi:ubiquinone/menaquinone biosynthesis C-methylase UbiE